MTGSTWPSGTRGGRCYLPGSAYLQLHDTRKSAQAQLSTSSSLRRRKGNQERTVENFRKEGPHHHPQYPSGRNWSGRRVTCCCSNLTPPDRAQYPGWKRTNRKKRKNQTFTGRHLHREAFHDWLLSQLATAVTPCWPLPPTGERSAYGNQKRAEYRHRVRDEPQQEATLGAAESNGPHESQDPMTGATTVRIYLISRPRASFRWLPPASTSLRVSRPGVPFTTPGRMACSSREPQRSLRPKTARR